MMNARRQGTETAPVSASDFEVSLELEQALADFSANQNASRDDETKSAIVLRLCRALRLNPLTSPIQWIRLQGKDTLYVTRTATDQLAALYGLDRATVRGPEVVDIAGTKVVLCQVKATLPGGRSEVATATLPLVDPVNVLMKCETKAKRRATLSILGLGLLAEEELETIPASQVERPRPPPVRSPVLVEPRPEVERELQRVERQAETLPAPPDEDPEREAMQAPEALQSFYGVIAEIELPGEAVAVWIKHRAELAALPADDRESAWKALCKKTEEVGRMKNAKVWLKKAIADEDARRGVAS